MVVDTLRTHKSLPVKFIVLGSLAVLLGLWLVPALNLNFFAVILIAILGFFFVAVTSMTVGLVGSSSNPASGIITGTLDHDGSAVFNVPEPGTVAIMGLGLLGLAGFARRRGRASN